MSDAQQLLAEVIDALGEAAEEERPMRIGHDVARVLHAALLDAGDKPAHDHSWQTLGYDRLTDGARVVQVCSCGDARELVAARAGES